MSELDGLISKAETNDTVETTAESQAEPEVEVQAQPDTPQGDKGEPPAPTEESQETRGLLAAKQAEKEKRQQAEFERDQLRQQLQALQNPPEEPDFYADPEEATMKVLTQRESAQLQARLEVSSELAKDEFPDYDKFEGVFVNAAKSDPRLAQKMLASPDPARYAYIKGKQIASTQEAEATISKAGGLAEYQKQLRAQILEELKAEGSKPGDPVPDLSGVRSAGGDPDNVIADGNEGLNQLLGR